MRRAGNNPVSTRLFANKYLAGLRFHVVGQAGLVAEPNCPLRPRTKRALRALGVFDALFGLAARMECASMSQR